MSNVETRTSYYEQNIMWRKIDMCNATNAKKMFNQYKKIVSKHHSIKPNAFMFVCLLIYLLRQAVKEYKTID